MSTLFNILKNIKKRFIKSNDYKKFDHRKAQIYEISYASNWLDNNFERVYRDVSDKKKQKHVISDEFFKNNDMILYSQNAEMRVPRLRNKIDGAIVCRNVLDHCENPNKVIENMAKYAKNGCYLLLWSDIYHKKGHNEGHANITKSKIELENFIKKNNFKIQHKFSLGKRNTINYGCVAIKNSKKL